jgi:hypothetical protein
MTHPPTSKQPQNKTTELDLLPRLPGLDPQAAGPEGDLFCERDLQQAANHIRAAGTPYGLARQGLAPAALHALAGHVGARRVAMLAAAGEEALEEAAVCSRAFARVVLGLEEQGACLWFLVSAPALRSSSPP